MVVKEPRKNKTNKNRKRKQFTAVLNELMVEYDWGKLFHSFT